VITDVGDKDDIHPTKKSRSAGGWRYWRGTSLTERRSNVTVRSIATCGIKGNQVILSFDHAGGGIESRGGRLRGFAVAAPTGNSFGPTRRLTVAKSW